MFLTIQFDSWEELRRAFGSRALWAFRGHADARWFPETSLFREAERQGSLEFSHLRERETWMLYQFRRFAHHHRADLPPTEDVADWLALIQHYGGPTRLLDFTYSLYVAAFFAVESAQNDAAVWCIDTDVIGYFAHEKFNAHKFGAIDEIRRQMTKRFNELRLERNVRPGVLHVEPDKMHERMYLQQGLFLASIDPNHSFLVNLAAMLDCDVSVFDDASVSMWSEEIDLRLQFDGNDEPISIVKLLLPREWHEEILDELSYMNINAATLFPGLEGFARSLRLHL